MVSRCRFNINICNLTNVDFLGSLLRLRREHNWSNSKTTFINFFEHSFSSLLIGLFLTSLLKWKSGIPYIFKDFIQSLWVI